MSHNLPNQDIFSATTVPLSPLPTPSNQFQQLPSQGPVGRHQKLRKREKIGIWFFFSVIVGTLPSLIIVLVTLLHNQPFVKLFVNGDLIAISIAIYGDILGQMIIGMYNRKDNSDFMKCVIIFGATLMLLLVAFIVLSFFVQLANCYQLHPKDAATACIVLGIPDSNAYIWSFMFFLLGITFGCITKSRED